MSNNNDTRPSALSVNCVALAKECVEGVLRPGDVAVDATAGNGHDTVFLARLVGPDGHVYAFDVQRAAIKATRERLARDEQEDRVSLICEDHANVIERLPQHVVGRVRAVMFNLGYLPGGDKSITTTAGTTIPALDAALQVLGPGGRLTIVVYTGHPQGVDESAAIETWLDSLSATQYAIEKLQGEARNAPYFISITRTG